MTEKETRAEGKDKDRSPSTLLSVYSDATKMLQQMQGCK